MRWLLIVIVLAASNSNCFSVEQKMVAVSLAGLQKAITARQISGALPLERVLGIAVADGDDLILIGTKAAAHPLSLSDFVLALRGVLMASQPPGLRAIRDFAPGLPRLRLLYSGGVENAAVGGAMSETLEALILASLGRGDLPSGFWPYPDLEKVRLWLRPAPAKCDSLMTPSMVVVDGTGLVLEPEPRSLDDLDFRIREWIAQVIEQYEYMGQTQEALDYVRKFLTLYHLLSLMKDRIRAFEWQSLLENYSVERANIHRSLSFDYEETVIEGVNTSPAGSTKCVIDTTLSETREKIRSIYQAYSSDWYFTFTAPPQLAAVAERDPRLLHIETQLKALGLFGKSIFLQLRLSEYPPALRILANSRISTRRVSSARHLKGLIQQAIEGKNVEQGWEDFYRTELAPLLTGAIQGRPLIGLVSDQIDPEWIRLDMSRSLSRYGLLFLILQADQDFPGSILRFLEAYSRVPRLENKASIGVVLAAGGFKEASLLKEASARLDRQNLLIDPSPEDLRKFLEDPSRAVILLEGHFRKDELILQNGSFNYEMALTLRRLDHIRYLGLGMLESARTSPWDREFVRALQARGVGIVSITRGSESSVAGRITALGRILRGADFAYQSALLLPELLALSGRTTYWERMP